MHDVQTCWDFYRAYRIQPNAETKAKQLEAWRTLVLDYCRVKKVWIIDVNNAVNMPLFYNSSINSECRNALFRSVQEIMVVLCSTCKK